MSRDFALSCCTECSATLYAFDRFTAWQPKCIIGKLKKIENCSHRECPRGYSNAESEPTLTQIIQDEKTFELVYELTHLAELYDEFVRFSADKDVPPLSFKDFAAGLKRKGAPFGRGVSLKQTRQNSTVVPVYDLYDLYLKMDGRSDLTLEEFAHHHKVVDRFRRETGNRSFLQPD